MPFFIPLYFDMVRIYENIELTARNSFGVPARAKRLIEFDEAEDLMQIFADEKMANEEWIVLAGGNNTLFTRDFEGTLICPQNCGIEIVATEGNTVHVRIGAGVEWDDAVAWSVEQGLWGIENLSLIPGKSGAAPVQNIGAYGTEVKDGIGMIASRAGVGFMPVYIKTKREKLIIFRRTKIVIGEYISPEELICDKTGREKYAYVSEYVFDKVCALGENSEVR